MNGIGSNLNFGTQIVPIKSEKPITPQEQADLAKVKEMLDEKMGKDVVSFKIKDDKNLDVIVNHPDPKVEKEIAAKMQEMAGAVNAKASAADAKAAPTGKNMNVVA